METFLFLLLIIGGEALFSWIKQKKEKSQMPPTEAEPPASPAEHLRELLKRYAENQPENQNEIPKEEYAEEPFEEYLEEEIEQPALETKKALQEENPVEHKPVTEPLAWAKYQGLAFERKVEEPEQTLVGLSSEPLKDKGLKVAYSLNSARAGFVWSKILDEPRFKKHWNPYSR